MFDTTKEVALTGTVGQFQWTNPHCYIQLMVKDAGGNHVEWSLEMGWRPCISTPTAGGPRRWSRATS